MTARRCNCSGRRIAPPGVEIEYQELLRVFGASPAGRTAYSYGPTLVNSSPSTKRIAPWFSRVVFTGARREIGLAHT